MTRWLLVGFGVLDLFAFYRNFPTLTRIFEKYEVSNLIPLAIPALTVITIVSLLVSGPLTVVGNKWGYVIYYFQFPLRLAFKVGLTFGFLFKIVPTITGTFNNGMLTATVFALEAIRLMLTIRRQK